MAIEEPDLLPFSDGDDADPPESDFDTVRRGFAPDQVAAYLKRVATSVLSLESRLEETRSELFETRRERDSARAALQAAAAPDPYESVSERVTGLVRTFDHQVGGLLREAEVEAERVLSEVQTEADRILAEARVEADHTVADARAEAERTLVEARAEAERTRADAQTEEQESRIRAGRLILEARREADRTESDLAALRGSMLDTFRDIRERTITALGEVEAVIESGGTPDQVVIVDEAAEPASADGPTVPRPDL